MQKILMFAGVLTVIGVIVAGCGGNQAPTVQVTSPQVSAQGTATANSKAVTFEVRGEDKDLPQGQKLTYVWDFGDGKPTAKLETQQTRVTYTYERAQEYTVKVHALDDKKTKSSEVSFKLTVRNAAPTADPRATPISGQAPLAVSLDGSASRDPDGTITQYEWDFGDGQKGSGPTVTHNYTEPGTYTVKLTVTDNEGARAERTLTITVDSGSSSQGKVWEVHIVVTADAKFTFEPAVLKINPGDTVRWICKSGCPHTATAYSTQNNKTQGIPTGAASWASDLLQPDGTFEFTFPANAPQGSYPYFCLPHEVLGQVGIIVVGQYTDLSPEFINSLPGGTKTEMQALSEQAKRL
jgi:PKD repeat protein